MQLPHGSYATNFEVSHAVDRTCSNGEVGSGRSNGRFRRALFELLHSAFLTLSTCSQAGEARARPGAREHGRRARLVLQGAFMTMALVAVAAAFARPHGTRMALEEASQVSATPDITKVIGPSQKMWMAWEDAHGLPKECTPAKEVTKGPHGEDVVTYYADCSMLETQAKAARDKQAKLHAEAAAKGARGSTALAQHAKIVHSAPFQTKAFQAKVHAEARKLIARDDAQAASLVVDPGAKKAAAKQALANKAAKKEKSSANDLEPPKLPLLLQGPKKEAAWMCM